MKQRWTKAFLLALENTGSVTEAAKVAKQPRTYVYEARRKDPAFANEWEQALERSSDLLMEEARRRAFNGSDILLMFLLKGLAPQRWRESRASISPSELNRLIEQELDRLSKQRQKQQQEFDSLLAN